MDSTIDIAIGQIVKSRAGRDKGRLFLVINIIDKEHILVVDGDLRKIENPKLKKIKHLIIYNKIIPQVQYNLSNKVMMNNADIRKLLEPFNKSF